MATLDVDANRDALIAELHVVRVRLRGGGGDISSELAAAEATLAETRMRLDGPNALDQVAEGFGLTEFERSVLLLAAGPELVGAVAEELVTAHGDPRPTFGLALSTMPGAHWSALVPGGPLRRMRLIHLVDPSSPTRSQLVPDERVLHHLVGAGYVDPELVALARPVPARPALPASLQTAADQVKDAWRDGRIAVVQGPQSGNLPCVAAAAAEAAGLTLHLVAVADLPTGIGDRDRLLRLMERETVLSGTAWAFDLDGARPEDVRGAVRALSSVGTPLVVLGVSEAMGSAREVVQVSVPRLEIVERVACLRAALARHDPGLPLGVEDVDAVAGVFDLSLPDLDLAAQDAGGSVRLWDACRARSRSRFAGQAHVIVPRAGWGDLVLPDSKVEQLRALVATVHHRTRVLQEWGFAARTGRGLGTAALFSGPSGTGKTLAAEVIAGHLGLDLVVIDLSQVVSKYIGETEKNLGRVFDAAEDGAAVLLFDEADTLFGKRTEVRDSHDRYANLEVGYLLQRMESFRGLAILTTNAKGLLDQAFLRRLRVVVTFPYPDRTAREALWRRAFPSAVPTDGVDPDQLSSIDLPGGGIAAAALTAAYLGAEAGVVSADQVSTATRWELAKNGRTLGVR